MYPHNSAISQACPWLCCCKVCTTVLLELFIGSSSTSLQWPTTITTTTTILHIKLHTIYTFTVTVMLFNRQLLWHWKQTTTRTMNYKKGSINLIFILMELVALCFQKEMILTNQAQGIEKTLLAQKNFLIWLFAIILEIMSNLINKIFVCTT